MSDNFCEFKSPVSWLPAGLISWFAPDGSPVALVTSWMALIGGDTPRLRMAWHGRHDSLSRFWAGGDFILNVPDETALVEIHGRMQQGLLCFKADGFFGYSSVSDLTARAPRLTGCPVQIECCNGVLIGDGFEPELSGDLVKIHRHGNVLSPGDVPEICVLGFRC